jgi:putative DNA primase/helicase
MNSHQCGTSVAGHDHAATRALAKRLLEGQLSDGFTCRTLTLKGWAALATKEQAQAAIDALVEYSWLFETEIRSGGRPSVKYTLHPSISPDLL